MADNVLETAQKLIQDVIAPDVRELKTRLDGLEKRADDRSKSLEQHLDNRFQRVDDRFKGLEQRTEDRFKSLERRMEDRFAAINDRFDLLQKVNANQIERVISAIAESKASGEVAAIREVGALRERIAVLEMQQRDQHPAA